LPNVPTDAISFEETGEEGHGIREDHNANKDQEAAAYKRYPTKIGSKAFEVAQKRIHSKGR
jgi:hypothetical protein